MSVEFVTQRFENTRAGIAKKDAFSASLAAQGYRIVSEQAEAGHAKGGEQCCLFMICMPCVFLAGRTAGTILVTYSRELVTCHACGSQAIVGRRCETCQRLAKDKASRAANATAEALKNMKRIQTLLVDGVSKDYALNWESLREQFSEAPPQRPIASKLSTTPIWYRLLSAMPFLERMAPVLRDFRRDWEVARELESQQREKLGNVYSDAAAAWLASKERFEQRQTERIESLKNQYLAKSQPALTEYWQRVLGQPVYVEQPPYYWSLNYKSDESRLIIEYALPPATLLPDLNALTYDDAQSNGAESARTLGRLQPLYSDVLVKMALVVIFKLFESDLAGALDSIAFNGTVTVIDPATGHPKSPCVVTLDARRSAFFRIKLSQVDPMACFTELGGTISPDLGGLVPITSIS